MPVVKSTYESSSHRLTSAGVGCWSGGKLLRYLATTPAWSINALGLLVSSFIACIRSTEPNLYTETEGNYSCANKKRNVHEQPARSYTTNKPYTFASTWMSKLTLSLPLPGMDHVIIRDVKNTVHDYCMRIQLYSTHCI